MKNVVSKKIVALIALSIINCGVFAQQIVNNKDQELAQKVLQAIQKSTDYESFRKAIDDARITKIALEADKDKAIRGDEKSTNFFIMQKVATPEFGNITLYEYAKKSGKKYLSNVIDQLVFYFLWYKSRESKNFDALKVLINQPDFNPNLKLSLRGGDEDVSDPLREMLYLIMYTQPPLEIIDLLLEKGASLTTSTTSLPGVDYASQSLALERKLQNWQIPFEDIKDIPTSLKSFQQQIANLMAQLEKTTNNEEKAVINKKILNFKEGYDNLNNASKYMNDLVALIKKHAQKRGETEILKGIAEYEKTLKTA